HSISDNHASRELGLTATVMLCNPVLAPYVREQGSRPRRTYGTHMNTNYRNYAQWPIIALMLIELFNLLHSKHQRGATRDVAYSQFLEELNNGRVESVTITGNRISGTYVDNRTPFQTYSPGDPNLVQRLEDRGVTITARPETDGSNSILGYFIS